MNLGERLRAIRTDLGLSQEAMAAHVGMAAGSWKRLELEDRAPKGEVLAQLVELGFSSDWLLSGIGQMRRDAPAETPPTPARSETDARLMGRLSDQISKIFKEMGRSVPLHQIVERAAAYHDRIVATVPDPDDRLMAAGELLADLRRELRAAEADPLNGKRSA